MIRETTIDQPTYDFIRNHADDDVNSLALRADLYPAVDMRLALRQIEGRQKVKHKVPAFFNNPSLLYPQKLSLEQSSSEVTARYKASLCRGNKLVDLTGGFGIDTFFFADSFNNIAYVEKQEELCEIAKYNFNLLEKNNITVYNQTAEEFLETDFDADWIYIDPARRKKDGAKAVLLSDCEPDAAKLQSALTEKAGNVMIKLSPMFDLTRLQREMRCVKEMYVVAAENECKEILVVLERNYSGNVQLKTVHFQGNKEKEVFEFTENEEKNSLPLFAENVQKYLYEPNAAILKAGAFKSIAVKRNLRKLHTNSHLYVSDALIADFQGRIFEVADVIPFNKTELRKHRVEKANISVRNFPLTVDELRKKLKIKEGGDTYIFATTLLDEKKALILCRKVNSL